MAEDAAAADSADSADGTAAARRATGQPGSVGLRPLRWQDLELILPLEQELFGGTAWAAETFWAELAHPETRWYIVAEDEAGHLLGYAGLVCPGSEADVQTIAVAAGAQGRGVGGVLLGALITEARARGATALLLEVKAGNDPAIGLYTSRGFERIAVRRRYYQPGDIDAWVMRLRPLPAPPPPG